MHKNNQYPKYQLSSLATAARNQILSDPRPRFPPWEHSELFYLHTHRRLPLLRCGWQFFMASSLNWLSSLALRGVGGLYWKTVVNKVIGQWRPSFFSWQFYRQHHGEKKLNATHCCYQKEHLVNRDKTEDATLLKLSPSNCKAKPDPPFFSLFLSLNPRITYSKDQINVKYLPCYYYSWQFICSRSHHCHFSFHPHPVERFQSIIVPFG